MFGTSTIAGVWSCILGIKLIKGHAHKLYVLVVSRKYSYNLLFSNKGVVNMICGCPKSVFQLYWLPKLGSLELKKYGIALCITIVYQRACVLTTILFVWLLFVIYFVKKNDCAK